MIMNEYLDFLAGHVFDHDKLVILLELSENKSYINKNNLYLFTCIYIKMYKTNIFQNIHLWSFEI